jgi:cytosine/adenosine deaminase-related metal-dependent hydrolase
MIHACRWLLPIDRPPIEGGWVETSRGVIRRFGQGRPPEPAVDLGDVALLPGLVNAHTHLELSWLAGRVPPADTFVQWVRSLLAARGAAGAPGVAARLASVRSAIDAATGTGTVLFGDVSNTLVSPALMAAAGVGGVILHELLGFNTEDASGIVAEATLRVDRVMADVRQQAGGASDLRAGIVAHAPYSVAPALFQHIALARGEAPLAVHVAEPQEEAEFLRTGRGPLRGLLDDLEVWNDAWEPPGTGAVGYLASLGYLQPGTLAVHAVHVSDADLDKLRQVEAVVVTCPRSNMWVGAGMPRVSHFYAARVPVAIGTDSLASVASLNLFDELAEMRRIAPDVTAASLLESATRVGAEALGFGRSHGTIAPGKVAALVVVDVPPDVRDVEEYLVGGVSPSHIRRLQ